MQRCMQPSTGDATALKYSCRADVFAHTVEFEMSRRNRPSVSHATLRLPGVRSQKAALAATGALCPWPAGYWRVVAGCHWARTTEASSDRTPSWWSRTAWIRRRTVSGADCRQWSCRPTKSGCWRRDERARREAVGATSRRGDTSTLRLNSAIMFSTPRSGLLHEAVTIG